MPKSGHRSKTLAAHVIARRQAGETWDEIGSSKPSSVHDVSKRHSSNHGGWRSHVAEGDLACGITRGCGHGCRHVAVHRGRCRCGVLRSKGWAQQHQGNEDGPQGHHGEMNTLVCCNYLRQTMAVMKQHNPSCCMLIR